MKQTKSFLSSLFFCTLVLAIVLSPGDGTADAADIYGKIMARKEIRIGIAQHYPPLNFKGGKSGVEMEMARELGRFLGVKVKMVKLPVAEYVPALKTNRVDIIMAGFSRNLKRGKVIWFSKPYVTVTPAVLVRKNALPQQRFGDEFEERRIQTIWDLKNLRRFSFSVKRGSAYIELLREHFPNAKRVLVKNDNEGLMTLQKGVVQGFVHDSLYMKYLYGTSASLRGQYRLLSGGKQTEKLCIGLPFGDMVLKTQIDLFIDEMIRTGKINAWLTTYSAK